MSATATSKAVKMSPRKVGVVASLVRCRTVADAIVILEHTPRASAKVVLETVKTASANAEHNHSYKPDGLFITEITVTPGPRYKRFRPVSRGMAHPYEKKTSHIRVVVDGTKREVKKVADKPKQIKETK